MNKDTAIKTGLNHLFTDENVAAEVVICVVDASGTGPTSSVTVSVPSFQEFLDYRSYCEELDVGYLNVRVGVNRVKSGTRSTRSCAEKLPWRPDNWYRYKEDSPNWCGYQEDAP